MYYRHSLPYRVFTNFLYSIAFISFSLAVERQKSERVCQLILLFRPRAPLNRISQLKKELYEHSRSTDIDRQ